MVKKFLVILTVIMLVSAFALGTTSAALGMSQTWYLKSSTHDDYGKVMNRGTCGSSTEIVYIDSSTAYWLSDESALTSVTFPSGSWVIWLDTTNTWELGEYGMKVGSWNPDNNTFTEFTTTTGTDFTYVGGLLRVEVLGNAGIVPKDHYLALEIWTTCDNYGIETCCYSQLLSPSTDPGYPLPEIATGILLCGGLLGLGGYFALRYRRNRLLEIRDN